MKHSAFGRKLTAVISLLLLIFAVAGCQISIEFPYSSQTVSYASLEDIPEFTDSPYIKINDNQPYFTEDDYSDASYESYGKLDKLGRCTSAIANIGKDLMPTEKRGAIGSVKPTGWQVAKYDFVDGKYLYNRCHLIGFQLTGENANDT